MDEEGFKKGFIRNLEMTRITVDEGMQATIIGQTATFNWASVVWSAQLHISADIPGCK